MKYKHLITALLSGAALLSFQSCKDDLLYDANGENYEGPVSLTLDFNFEPLEDINVSTRDEQGNLDFKINNLTLLIYKSDAAETDAPIYTQTFNNPATTSEERTGASDCEDATYHASLSLTKELEAGSYRIYAIANVGESQFGKNFDQVTETDLRELKIEWGTAVPDAMFGFFTVEEGTHPEGNKDVIYHPEKTNRAPEVNLNQKEMTIQAWMKRVVSKLTIGFDGSGLKPGISIYIKSVKVVNAASSTYLGQDNTIDENGVVENPENDSRLNIPYSSETPISREKPAFPRDGLAETVSTKTIDENDESTWNTKWFNKVHESSTSQALYFMENLQGELEDGKSKEKMTETDFTALAESDKYPTYVEVQAYYIDNYTGKQTKGDITYRYILGNDATTDCNVERNTHYQLTLSFIGDANKVTWNISYTDEPSLWFRIPYTPETDGIDGTFSDNGENYTETWHPGENWNRSWVWYAYKKTGDNTYEPIAEIAREMVFSHSRGGGYGAAYQVVSVYPIKNGFTDLKNGLVVQVLKCENEANGTYFIKEGGIPISMYYRYEQNLFTKGRKGSNLRPTSATRAVIECDITQYAEGNAGDSYKENNGKYLYIKYDKNTDKLSVLKEPGKKDYRLQTRPYLVQDKDKNKYSVVKIGASYWLRENMRAEHMFSKDEILNGNKSAGDVEISNSEKLTSEDYHVDFGDYDEIGDVTQNVSTFNRYTNDPNAYNLANKDLGVYLPADKAAYKEYKSDRSKYGLLYNFNTIAGRNESPKAYLDGLDTRTYKRHGRIIQLEDNMRELGSSSAQITLPDDYNDWQITPPGWHVPTSETSNVYDDDMDLDRNESFGAYCDDIQYLIYYMRSNLVYAIRDDDNLNWPSAITGKDTKQNLSGLSFYPITNAESTPELLKGANDYPYNEYSQYFYTSSTNSKPWEHNNLGERVKNIYLPFWSVGLVYSASYFGVTPAQYTPIDPDSFHSSGHVAWLPIFYHSNGQLMMGPGYTSGYAGAPGAPYMSVLYPWCKLLTEQYLPIRACRNNFESSYKAQTWDQIGNLWPPTSEN